MKIIFYFEDSTKKEFVTTKETVKIGRGSDCDLNITKPGFSQTHALIKNEDGEFFVTDLQSTNSVYIDGNRIQASERNDIKAIIKQVLANKDACEATFVKNIGAVSDKNKSHQFYGAQETSVDIAIYGHSYDHAMVNHTLEEELESEYVAKASANGFQCTVDNQNDICSFEKLSATTHDDASDQRVSWGGYRFFRDYSPFADRTTPK